RRPGPGGAGGAVPPGAGPVGHLHRHRPVGRVAHAGRQPLTHLPLDEDHGGHSQEGDVSWYDLPGSVSGVCAHRTIAKGTTVTVTNLDTGQSITCVVDDRGPYTDDGKILDLHVDEFSQLAPLEQGVFPARIDW
ncbi:MAG TPA: RlpA-like double-psi beta-barrel domain-containing protein, partial [Acidimicrobiales bacterium]|nr:RlpA-like double-psi beta-barrel domain-containing protein [Acidimicrobiales bacterium]